MTQFNLSNLRFILDSEDDNYSPASEELMQQLRENIEVLFMLLSDTGVSGAATEDPPDDTTGVLTDGGSPAQFEADEHNGRTLLITSGIAKNITYTIDDTTTTTLICTDDNLYSAGVRSGDTYKILYDIKVNTDGHDHDGVNSPIVGASSVDQAALKTTIHDQSLYNETATWTAKTLTYNEYGFGLRMKCDAANVFFKRADDTDYQTIGSTEYVGEDVYLKTGSEKTFHLRYRYITSSGEIFWIWILRDKITKTIISMDIASDHCSFGLPDPNLRPHPFEKEYNKNQHEIILINPTKEELRQLYQEKAENNRWSLTETFLMDFKIDENSNIAWPKEKVSVQLVNDDWFERWIRRQPATVIKKVIPEVAYVLCRKMKPRKDN